LTAYSKAHFAEKINPVTRYGYAGLWAGGEADPWGFPASARCGAGGRVAIVPALHRARSWAGEGTQGAVSITGHYACMYIKYF